MNSNPPSIRNFFARLFLLSILLFPCACGEAPPPAPETDPGVNVTLSWKNAGDLDLVIDGISAHRIPGGSPNMTSGGGSEVFVLSKSGNKDSVIVGVVNRSGEPGGSGDTNILANLTITDRSGRSESLTHTMVHDRWDAFVIFPKFGTFAAYESGNASESDTSLPPR